jgi:hypothetical protein
MSGRFFLLFFIVSLVWIPFANSQDAAPNAAPIEMAKIEPYRTFVTIERYSIESNGDASQPISNVRLTITFPNGQKVELPEGGQYWPIGNGQAQEINRTFEIPWAYIQKDGFKFKVQMERKGSPMLPCEFDVVQLSQFNRAYTCHTDIAWQQKEKTAEDKLDREGIQVRVFSSRNTPAKEVPTNAIALKPQK